MILFAVYDGGIKTIAEPHLAVSIDAARLSLGRFFIEHEDMKDRIDSTSVVVLGDWDHEYGLRSLSHDFYPASECIDFYLQEVKKQNEGALQETVSSDSHGV